MPDRGVVLTGLSLGAGLMYLLDPDRGRARRARVRDRVAHATTVARRAAGTAQRDVANRAAGAAARVRHAFQGDAVDDTVLLERVRARMGRRVSHPHAIDVDAADGIVVLRGPILRSEVEGLLDAVRHVRGVRDVISDLDVHESPHNVPALQGGRMVAPRGAPGWRPTTRLVTGTTGAALAGYGASRRDGPGLLLAAAGVGLVARATSNVELGRLTGVGGGHRGVDLQKTITIDAPVDEVFVFWSEYSNFPLFLSRVFDVRRAGGRRPHWTVAGPAGLPVEFDTEVTAFRPNKAIGWRTTRRSPVAHAGLVRFDREGDGRTRVQVRMSYNPPGGWAGHGVASAFGVDPKSSFDADLLRMKTLLETGRRASDATRAH